MTSNKIILKDKIEMARKHYIFSMIIGIVVGALLAGVLSLIQRSLYPQLKIMLLTSAIRGPIFQFYDPSWLYLSSSFAPGFIALFSLILAKRYSTVWRDATARVYYVFFALLGYSIGWYHVMFSPFFRAASIQMLNILLWEFIRVPFLAPHLIRMGVPFSLPGVLILTALSYYVTRDIDRIGERILLFVLMMWLGLWPYLIIFSYVTI
jgi:hypothetical protein